jgi:hypothetical protein
MLNNLTNFFNIIKGRMIRTSATVASTDIIALGVVNPNYDGGYLPSAITVGDLQVTLSTPSLEQVLNFNHELTDGNNFQGTGAGLGQSGVTVIGFGDNAVSGNTGSSIVAFGNEAGMNNTGNNSIFINNGAGRDNSGDDNIGLGIGSLENNSGNHVNAFGKNAGTGNQLSGQTIFSDASFPVYADATAATTAISLANNASAGSVYLYYDTALGAVSAVFPV